jgi:cell division protease FtsH
LLGGRAAEELIFDDISTGAHNDLSRATDIARSMVKEYGMSERIGQVYFARKKRSKYLQVMPEGPEIYSESTAELIDQEVREIIGEQYRTAIDILKDKKDLLNDAFELLIEKESIEGDDLSALAEKVKGGTPAEQAVETAS